MSPANIALLLLLFGLSVAVYLFERFFESGYYRVEPITSERRSSPRSTRENTESRQ